MISSCLRVAFATVIATVFIAFSVPGASPRTYSTPEFTRDLHNHVTPVATQSRKARRSSSPVSVSNIRFHPHKTYMRVVLDLHGQTRVSESKDSKRQRAVFQLEKTRLSKTARQRLAHKDFPRGIDIAEESNQTVSVTLDLAVVDKYKPTSLQRPHRFVIDLYYSPTPAGSPDSVTAVQQPKTDISKEATTAAEPTTPAPGPAKTSAPPKSSPPDTVRTDNTKSVPTGVAFAASAKSFKDLLVVIDPGHGGKDPGAVGARGTREKEITLNIAKALQDIIQHRLGTKVLLTRTTDVFLNLEDRVAFANSQKADVFMSIHVNSNPQKSIKGLEVYHFGKASDPRALEVAARENGMTLEENAPAWQFIIADKLNDQKIEESRTFAWTTRETLLSTLNTRYSVTDHGVKTAPFYVLRFTTMPSILAEVAFVSNQSDEKLLRSRSYQQGLAEGMYKGIHAYLKTLYPGIS